ncbi:MAG: acetate--CoA ligase [Phycisphaeraceae bacterium]
MTQDPGDTMESVLHEKRKFPPSKDFAKNAHIPSFDRYEKMYRQSVEDPETFWAGAAEGLTWFEKWDQVLEWDLPDAKWFVGGKLNACYNCVDRQVEAGFGDRKAIIWEAEAMTETGKPHVREITYEELLGKVARFANVLKKLGVRKGDIVTLYMPMVPELAIAMLACARIGAAHSIIFGGFSASAIRDRVLDADSKVVITADGGWRRGSVVPLKKNVDEALAKLDSIEHVAVFQHTHHGAPMTAGRDKWWHELVDGESDHCPVEYMDSEDLLFVLYTSGTTGKPKGIMHTTGGYSVYTWLTAKYVFDLHERDENQVYWCTADIGWITGHSYIIYGILPNRTATLMYEGAPNWPHEDRFWDIVERHRVTHFYTAPTAVRAFMKWGDEHVEKHNLSSLRLLGSVGEPLNAEAFMWYHDKIGGGRCPIVDTWWQTETGGHMLTPLPGATTLKPGSVTRPFFGVQPDVVDRDGNSVDPDTGGFLVIRKPWPGMLRGIWGDRERFLETYWRQIEGVYFAGDSAKRDEEGNFWVMGRVDDVLNVSGHRLGTAEVESALANHHAVAEAAVVGVPHEVKGTGVAAFVTLKEGYEPSEGLEKDLIGHVGREIGAIAKPDVLRFTDALPKTRSGKIMRRLLREVATSGEVHGDTTTLEDAGVLRKLQG